MNVQPLRAIFESLTDPFAEQRRNQRLGRTLTMLFMAMVSGENSERGIAAWIEEQRWRLKKIFGFKRDDVPCYSTIQRALQTVDAQELESKLVEWAKALQDATNGEWEVFRGRYLMRAGFVEKPSARGEGQNRQREGVPGAGARPR